MNATPHGAIVVHRHRPAGEAAQAGDVVDVYPLLEVVHEFRQPDAATTATRPVENPHALARREAPSLLAERVNLRPSGQRGCDCSRKGRSRPLVAAYVRQGQLWIWVAPQRFPAAVRDEVLAARSVPTAWPAHVEPSGRPHQELATCRLCHKQWAVLIDTAGFRLVRLDRPEFGAVVTA